MADVEREQLIQQRAESNLDDVMKNGPRLALGRSTWIEARSGFGHVLRGGLGSMGIGRMWSAERQETIHSDDSRTAPDSEDPTYADAPIAPDAEDDFGRFVRPCGCLATADELLGKAQHRCPE